MSSIQRNAIANPRKGLMVYDTTQSEHVYFDGGKWRPFYAQNVDSAVVDYSGSASFMNNLPLYTGGATLIGGNSGFIFDNSGPTGNYQTNSNSFLELQTDDSTVQFKIIVEEMNTELFYDSLFLLSKNIFNSNYDTLVRLGGVQTGTFLFSGDLRIAFRSNSIVNQSGFKIRWSRIRLSNQSPIFPSDFGWHTDYKKYASMGGVQTRNNWNTDSVGYGSLSYGIGNNAKGNQSVALGLGNISTGNYSFAVGESNSATGKAAIAVGGKSKATGDYSTSMGFNTKAVGTNSTALGLGSLAGGNESTAMGYQTKAMGVSSTAMGEFTSALGIFSSTMGKSVIAKGYASNVIGMYNDSLLTTNQTNLPTPTTPLFIIGNGDNNATRSNAMVVYKNGNVEINGNLKIDNGTNVWSSVPTGFAANRTTTLIVTPSSFTDVVFTTQSSDDGGDNYDPVTGEFTAPSAGMYRFEASVLWASGIAGFENIYFYVNGVTRRFHTIVSTNTSSHTLPFTASFKLNAGDAVKVVAYHTNATAVNISANGNGTYFTGVKVY